MEVKWTKNQQRIVEFSGGNLLVAAGAGSGKTAVLTAHIVEQITNPVRPLDLDRLLVVTFTNAAAAQMKERVRLNLEGLLEQQPDNEHLIRQIGLIPAADISTIHSFCLKLIREQFFRLDLDPGFRLGDPGELALMKADLMEELFEEQYEHQVQSFLDFRDMYGKGIHDEAVIDQILKLFEYAQSNPYPDQWLADTLTDRAGFAEGLLQTLRRETLGLQKRIEQAASQAADSHIPAKLLNVLWDDAAQLTILSRQTDLDDYCRALGQVTFSRKPTLNKQEKQEALGAEGHIDRAFAERDQVKKALQKLQEQYAHCSMEQIAFESEKTAPMEQEMVRLVQLFSERFARKKRSLGICDFSDLEHMALKLLYDENHEPSEVADTYARSYDEILIDEYQDCNLVQEQILLAVSQERFGRENRFMVGDVKQSIYGFRQARPELFLEKYDTYSASEEAARQKVELSTNFRSRAGVLEGINRIFGRIMTRSLGGMDYDEYAALKPGGIFPDNPRPEPDLELMLLKLDGDDALQGAESPEEAAADETPEDLPDDTGYNNREYEARMVAARISRMVEGPEPSLVYDGAARCMRPARYKDIVILMRSLSATQEDYMRIFREMGVPVYADNESGYFSSVEVSTILQLLRVLDNPIQDIPLAGVMRSPIGGFSPEELAAIRLTGAAKGCGQTLYSCCMAAREGNEKLDRFLFSVEQYRRLARFLPIHGLLLRILEETGYRYYVEALPGGKKRLKNLDMLVAKARDYEETSYKGLFHFIRYIDRLRRYQVDGDVSAQEDEELDAVRIMTIHKSKGLEFPIVFLCNAGGHFNKMDLNGAVLLDARYGVATDIKNPTYRFKTRTLKKAVFRQRQLQGLLEEELRVLYVAMTRAKERLIITGSMKNAEKNLERLTGGVQRDDAPLPLHLLKGADSYLDWIIPAMQTDQYDFGMTCFTKAQVHGLAPMPTEAAALEEQQDYRAQLEQILNWTYPQEALTDLHAAISVSQLKHQAMEAEGVTPYAVQEPDTEEPGNPKAVKVDGASRGSAYHRVLELLDFADAGSKASSGEALSFVTDAMEQMVSAGQLEQDRAGMVCAKDLADFLATPLAKRMERAAERKALHREQPFLLGVPAGEFAPEAPADAPPVLVRGIIDCYFEEDGGIILVDYKTDRVGRRDGDEILIRRYRAQLLYYKRALEAFLDCPVAEGYLYAFALGRAIRVW